MKLNDAVTCLWLTKSHWPTFTVMNGDQQALQAGAWLDVLSDVDLPDVRVALARIDADGNEFPPTPGQIRHQILAARGLTAPDHDQAYMEVDRGIGTHGRYSNRGVPEWSHPAIGEAVLSMGGWFDVCQAAHTDTWRSQFRKAYEASARRADREATAPPIVRQLAQQLGETLSLAAAFEDPEDTEDTA